MISSFFGKTKPINNIVLASFLFLFYFTNVFFELGDQRINQVIPLEMMLFAVLLVSVFITNQIVRTEKATESNSYAMLFFVLLIVTFSDELVLQNVLFASFHGLEHHKIVCDVDVPYLPLRAWRPQRGLPKTRSGW